MPISMLPYSGFSFSPVSAPPGAGMAYQLIVSAQADHFAYAFIAGSPYRLTATGSGPMQGCVLSLDAQNSRTATSDCGFTSW